MIIDKQYLDNYFTTNHTGIIEYIEKSFSKHNVKRESSSFFFSKAYEYLLDKVDDLKTEKDVKNYLSTFIYKNSYWRNSSVREALHPTRSIKNVEYEEQDFENLQDDEYDYSEEQTLNEYKAVSEMYYASLKSVEKRAIWEIYFVHNKVLIKDFAKHIGMSKSISHSYIVSLKKEMKEFYDEYKANKNITV